MINIIIIVIRTEERTYKIKIIQWKRQSRRQTKPLLVQEHSFKTQNDDGEELSDLCSVLRVNALSSSERGDRASCCVNGKTVYSSSFSHSGICGRLWVIGASCMARTKDMNSIQRSTQINRIRPHETPHVWVRFVNRVVCQCSKSN